MEELEHGLYVLQDFLNPRPSCWKHLYRSIYDDDDDDDDDDLVENLAALTRSSHTYKVSKTGSMWDFLQSDAMMSAKCGIFHVVLILLPCKSGLTVNVVPYSTN